jgi:DNA-binding CsgD family transcriptional regulator
MQALIDEPLVTALYDSALYGGDWQPALARFSAVMKSAEVSLCVWPCGQPGPLVQTTGRVLTPEAQHRYTAYYGSLDPKLNILARHTPQFLFNEARHFSRDFIARDPFYQEYSRSVGTRHTLDMTLSRTPKGDVFLAAMRTPAQGPYGKRAEAAFRQIATHFSQVLKLKDKIDRAEQVARKTGSALDRLGFGVVVLDRVGRVVLANRAAERAFAPGEELQLRQGRLSARSAALATRLEALIGATMAGEPCADALIVPRHSGSAWTVWFAPLPERAPLALPVGTGTLVLIGDSERRATVCSRDLTALYGLTAAEAELALLLAEGLALGQAAKARSVKISTARSQLLSVLRKTGARGQSDLMRMLAGLPGALLANLDTLRNASEQAGVGLD